MAKSSTRPGWWRTGKLWCRFVCLGAVSGTVGALALHLSYTLPRFNPVFLLWGLFNLFVFEMPALVILGVVVAGAVIVARLAVAEEATRKTRATVTGVVALVTSGGMAFALSNLVQTGNPWAVAGITGAFVGSTFAMVTYRHTSEA